MSPALQGKLITCLIQSVKLTNPPGVAMSYLLCNTCYRTAQRPDILLKRHAATWRLLSSRVTSHAGLDSGVTSHPFSSRTYSTDQRNLNRNSLMQRNGKLNNRTFVTNHSPHFNLTLSLVAIPVLCIKHVISSTTSSHINTPSFLIKMSRPRPKWIFKTV